MINIGNDLKCNHKLSYEMKNGSYQSHFQVKLLQILSNCHIETSLVRGAIATEIMKNFSKIFNHLDTASYLCNNLFSSANNNL